MMILGSKHVGANFNVLMWNFYVCASVGILIKQFDDMHGATIRTNILNLLHSILAVLLASVFLHAMPQLRPFQITSCEISCGRRGFGKYFHLSFLVYFLLIIINLLAPELFFF